MVQPNAMTEPADWWDAGCLSVEEVKALTTCGHDSVYRWMRDGDLIFTTMGRRRLISKKSLMRLLARNQSTAVAAG